MEAVQRQIEQLQRQLSDIARDEARQFEKITQLTRELASATQPSTRDAKSRALHSCHNDAARLQSKRADLTKRIADRTIELHRWQQKLYREQAREQKAALDGIRRDYDTSRQRQVDRAVMSLRTEAASAQATDQFDAFISHATEDKDGLVRPLAERLAADGFRIWYDEFQLRLGDSLRRSIDRGLASSRFGIVVLSPSFFAKNWPQYELDGLVAREIAGGKIILPLWHKVSKDEVLSYSPTLADKVALNTAMFSIDELAAALARALRSE